MLAEQVVGTGSIPLRVPGVACRSGGGELGATDLHPARAPPLLPAEPRTPGLSHPHRNWPTFEALLTKTSFSSGSPVRTAEHCDGNRVTGGSWAVCRCTSGAQSHRVLSTRGAHL